MTAEHTSTDHANHAGPVYAPASSAIVMRKGRLLLVKRSKPPAAALYAFPGGRGEKGETPQDTCLRELQEETGLVAQAPHLLTTFHLKPDPGGPAHHHFRLSVFTVTLLDETQEPKAASDAERLGWFSAAEIKKLPVPDSVLTCLALLETSGQLEAQ